MPNLLAMSGAQSEKPLRFAPIYTGRWASGIWTNRSPLRDAATTRLTEKFYGPAGDALIAGSNVEITPKLTLGRRPGNSVFDSNSYTSVDSFYDFRLFNPTTEEIIVMVDQANALYSLLNGTKTLVWNKQTGAGQTFMQSVGNTLFFADGVSNKKWLQTLFTWSSAADWTTVQTPVYSTFLIDPNGNIQQLTTAGVSGATQPTWNTTVPSSGNDFAGGTTTDGSAIWTNRGNPVENWGIKAPTQTFTPTVGSSRSAWQKSTYFSLAGIVIDTNGNVQQVTTAGKSGATTPTWNTSPSGTTTDGTVVWTNIQSAASLTWAAHTNYAAGSFLVANASGTDCLFQRAADVQPSISGTISAYLYAGPTTGPVGCFILTFPTTTGSALASATGLTSIDFTGTPLPTGATLTWNTLNGAGETTGTTDPFPGHTENYQLIILGSITVPVAGQYSFTIEHHDGMIWGIGNGAVLISGTSDNPIGQTQTANQGYAVFGGTNRGLQGGQTWIDNFTVNFPTAGTYGIEADYSYWYHSGQVMNITCNGNVLAPGTAESGTTEPVWPSWTTAFAPLYPSVTESAGRVQWNNLGPITDYVWMAQMNFTLPNSTIIDSNGNTEAPYRTGYSSSTTQPTWATGQYQLTTDNPSLIWINQGPASSPPAGTLSTFNGGWQYCVALMNSLDQTYSNAGPLTAATGNFIGAAGVVLAPGAGLPPAADIDPQADFVAIFRTTDGQSVPFLIPGTNDAVAATVPLSTYLTAGYTDTATDEELNNLLEAPILGENTPPPAGAVNLSFHLNRIFFSVGNTVYWTSGPDTPIGNGLNGCAPANFDELQSLVKRIVPTTSGAFVFTVSDTNLIGGQGTASNPIQPGIPVFPGLGLSSYNALDVNGSIIGFFSTDRQFIILDPSNGVDSAGIPLGDQFRLNNGTPGQSWNPASVYVTWHVNGEDQAWYVCDGQYGWYRLMPTPAPETGYSWCPFAAIVGGVRAVKSIETTPGEHHLLLGPASTGPILMRDLATNQDNGSSYIANAVIGSAVLAQPGQIAVVSFITTESVNVGTPLTIGVLIDEALPYYTGPIETLTEWTPDPPGLPRSRSFLAQRFYLSELNEAAACRHMQMRINWAAEDFPNELNSLTVFGAYQQEN